MACNNSQRTKDNADDTGNNDEGAAAIVLIGGTLSESGRTNRKQGVNMISIEEAVTYMSQRRLHEDVSSWLCDVTLCCMDMVDAMATGFVFYSSDEATVSISYDHEYLNIVYCPFCGQEIKSL